MTANLHVDVSEHQDGPIDSSYDLSFFMFRLVNEFGHIDKLAPENLRRSIGLRAQGKLINFGGYADAGHVNNATFLDAIDQIGFPRDAVLMNDAEPWPGEGPGGDPLITGDHTAVHSDLVTKARARQSGRAELVWGYLGYYNQGLWTARPDWLGMVMPWYDRATRPPDYGHLIGWQFTDGAPGRNATSYRDSTPPFGHVDHNVMFIDYPRPSAAQTEDDMFEDADRALMKRIGDVLHANTDGIKDQLTEVQAKTDLGYSRLTSVQDAVGAMRPIVAGFDAQLDQLADDVAARIQSLPAGASGDVLKQAVKDALKEGVGQ